MAVATSPWRAAERHVYPTRPTSAGSREFDLECYASESKGKDVSRDLLRSLPLGVGTGNGLLARMSLLET